MARPIRLARDELAEFLPSQRAVIAFERLVQTAMDVEDADVANISFTAELAESKSNEALQEIARIRRALEMMAYGPAPQEHNSLSTDYIDLPINGPHQTQARRIQWNDDDGTLDVGLYGGSVLQVGQETLYYAKNTSGAQIDNGTPVMLTGTVGASGKLEIGPAVADGTEAFYSMMGVATQDIADNDFGYVTDFGLVRGWDTSGTPYGETWNDGDLLYFDPSSPGSWTNVRPAPSGISLPQAVVVHAASGNSGSIFVRMELDHSLGTLEAPSRDVTGTVTVGAYDYLLLADASGGAVTVNLPAAASSNGRVLIVKKVDSSINSVTLDGNGSETIDGATTQVIAVQYTALKLICDGTEWWLV